MPGKKPGHLLLPAAAALAVFAALTGCRTPSEGFFPAFERVENPAQLASSLDARAEAAQTGVVIGTIEYRGPVEGRTRSVYGIECLIAFSGEDKFRLQAFLAEQKLVDVLIDGDTVQAYLPSEKKVYEGKLNELAGFDVCAEFGGRYLFFPRFDPDAASLTSGKRQYVVKMTSGGSGENISGRLHVNIASRTPEFAAFGRDSEGKEEVTVRYLHFRKAQGREKLLLPDMMVVSLPELGAEVELVRVEKFSLDPADVKESAFRMRIPGNVERLPLKAISETGEGKKM